MSMKLLNCWFKWLLEKFCYEIDITSYSQHELNVRSYLCILRNHFNCIRSHICQCITGTGLDLGQWLWRTSSSASESVIDDLKYTCTVWKYQQQATKDLYILLLFLNQLLPICPPYYSTAVIDPRFTVSAVSGCAVSFSYLIYSMVRKTTVLSTESNSILSYKNHQQTRGVNIITLDSPVTTDVWIFWMQ